MPEIITLTVWGRVPKVELVTGVKSSTTREGRAGMKSTSFSVSMDFTFMTQLTTSDMKGRFIQKD